MDDRMLTVAGPSLDGVKGENNNTESESHCSYQQNERVKPKEENYQSKNDDNVIIKKNSDVPDADCNLGDTGDNDVSVSQGLARDGIPNLSLPLVSSTPNSGRARLNDVPLDAEHSTCSVGECSLSCGDDNSDDTELLASTASGTQTDWHPEPGTFHSPIIGYEIMEERAKFTVFKLKVEHTDNDSWFIFRRYSDFDRLNRDLKGLFPHFRLALPPKRWFGDNFDLDFLEDRQLGLQAFLNNISGHRDISRSRPVRKFFCFDDPPGPHDSLEESRAFCESLEEQVFQLQSELRQRDKHISTMQKEVVAQKGQIDSLHTMLRIERARGAGRRLSPGSQRSECSLPEHDQLSNVPCANGDEESVCLAFNLETPCTSSLHDQISTPSNTVVNP